MEAQANLHAQGSRLGQLADDFALVVTLLLIGRQVSGIAHVSMSASGAESQPARDVSNSDSLEAGMDLALGDGEPD